MRKFFDKELHAQFDGPAKNAVLKLFSDLEGYQFQVQENEKKRGVDLLVYKDDIHVFNVETEVKRVWKSEFAYDSVQFPERKQKFAELDLPTLFIMFNHDLSEYLVVNGADLIGSPKEMVRNRYVSYGEYFFQVPLNRVLFNNLKKSIINLRGNK